MTSFRLATPDDAKLVTEWYKGRGFLDPAPSLPPLGAVALLHDEPAGVMWCYEFVGTSLAMIDWMCSKPGLTPKQAREVLRGLFTFLELQLQRRGVTAVLAQFSEPLLAREAENVGFAIVARDVINVAKLI